MTQSKKTKKRMKRTAEEPGQVCDIPNPTDVVKHVSDSPCSIEFSRDAKGQPRWAIKLYGERDDMDDVLNDTLNLDRRLREEMKSGT